MNFKQVCSLYHDFRLLFDIPISIFPSSRSNETICAYFVIFYAIYQVNADKMQTN